jgi:dihydroneopterin aldolase
LETLPRPFKLDVKLTLNDTELPLLETFADFEKQVDKMVKEKAFELIDEKLSDIKDTMTDIFKEVEDKIRKELNLPKENDY